MIQVKLWGGLCNQMFQYAFGYAMAKKNEDELVFDISFFEKQPTKINRRTESLRRIYTSIKFDTMPREGMISLLENKYINHIIYHRFNSEWILPNATMFFKEKHYQYYECLPYINEWRNYYDGYWQSEDYFFEYRDEIKRLFDPKAEIKSRVDKFNNNEDTLPTVAIHIRRGDLFCSRTNATGYNDRKLLNYYYEAEEYMRERLGELSIKVFSDDIEWCKTNLQFKSRNVEFVTNGGDFSDVVDLFCIAKCNHGIMSPSTFSWWGNWLGDNKKRIVVAPKGIYFNTKFIPERWTKI